MNSQKQPKAKEEGEGGCEERESFKWSKGGCWKSVTDRLKIKIAADRGGGWTSLVGGLGGCTDKEGGMH